MFEETREALPLALKTQRYGVVHALTVACHKLVTKQASCMKVCTHLLSPITQALVNGCILQNIVNGGGVERDVVPTGHEVICIT